MDRRQLAEIGEFQSSFQNLAPQWVVSGSAQTRSTRRRVDSAQTGFHHNL